MNVGIVAGTMEVNCQGVLEAMKKSISGVMADELRKLVARF